MKKTIVIYGSSTGTCQAIANTIASKLGTEAIDVAKLEPAHLQEAENLLLGTSTWGAGELQDDWYDGIAKLREADLNGKTVALFGCGDAEVYGDTFCGGMAELYNAVKNNGVKIIGQVSTEGYSFNDSEAVIGGQFIGLVIDDIDESHLTEQRIEAWTTQLKPML